MSTLLSTILLLGCLVFACQAVKYINLNFDSGSEAGFEKTVEQSSLKQAEFQLTHFDDCEDAHRKGYTNSGVYRIKPKSSYRPFNVWCDMETDRGGWTVIQARFDGLVDFHRTWKEYRNGFGSVDSEHWLGNNFIRHLTENNDYELKIELTGYEVDEIASAKYSPFRIGSEDEKYKLYVGQFTSVGVIVDKLSYHNGAMFSTKDSENDICLQRCAQSMMGGWWYVSCYYSNLNGVWMSKARSIATKGLQTTSNQIGINWRSTFNNSEFYSLKSVEMKVRRIK